MKYDAVIFDLFGTLIDNMDNAAFNAMAGQMADILMVPQQPFIALWGATWPERAIGAFPSLEVTVEYVCEQLNLPVTSERVSAAAHLRVEYTRSVLVPRPDTIETLTRLKEAGYKIGLVSDCTSEVPVLWPSTPLISLIDEAIFSCVAGIKKPDPRIYWLVCEKLGVAPDKCLYMGDGGSRELTGAHAVGMSPVLIRVPYENEANVTRADEEEWEGTRITAVKDILAYVDETLIF